MTSLPSNSMFEKKLYKSKYNLMKPLRGSRIERQTSSRRFSSWLVLLSDSTTFFFSLADALCSRLGAFVTVSLLQSGKLCESWVFLGGKVKMFLDLSVEGFLYFEELGSE